MANSKAGTAPLLVTAKRLGNATLVVAALTHAKDADNMKVTLLHRSHKTIIHLNPYVTQVVHPSCSRVSNPLTFVRKAETF
jgi:hypothetical protein